LTAAPRPRPCTTSASATTTRLGGPPKTRSCRIGEEGIDTDTGTRKVGDGVTAWSSLPDRLGDEADARAAADAALDIRVDALEVAPPAHTHPLADVTDAGTAAAADVGDFATAAQGTLADSATQPGDLATVATTGAYADLSGKPALGTAAATAATDYATAAQGVKADDPVPRADRGQGRRPAHPRPRLLLPHRHHHRRAPAHRRA
jgi:hypothetical protein